MSTFEKKNHAKLSKVLLISMCHSFHHHYHNHVSEPEGKQDCRCDSHFLKELNQSGISLNLRTGPTGHATLFNQ